MIADESRVQRCKLVDCDVVCCVLVKTDFEGMVVRNGVWKDGVLVGKVREGEEVVVLKKGDIRVMFFLLFSLFYCVLIFADCCPACRK